MLDWTKHTLAWKQEHGLTAHTQERNNNKDTAENSGQKKDKHMLGNQREEDTPGKAAEQNHVNKTQEAKLTTQHKIQQTVKVKQEMPKYEDQD